LIALYRFRHTSFALHHYVLQEDCNMNIDGRCHCGYITFEADADPDKAWICHCTDCQSFSGSAFRTIARVRDGTFRLLSGEPTVYVKTADSGAQRAQAFCPRCGSPIYATAAGDGPKSYSVRLGTVRQRDQFTPKVQIWGRSRQRWVVDLASVRSVETQ
jgi:hypothetical protein